MNISIPLSARETHPDEQAERSFFQTRPLFQQQLEACGADYFDYYLMHAQNADEFERFKQRRAYGTAFELKKEGKMRHVGISFHDCADILEKILTEYPQIEVVQIQFNDLDYDDPAVQSRKCREVCRKFDKPVLIMEPVKSGHLVNLPDSAKKVLDDLHGGSYASYAIRFAADFPGVMMLLSGMSDPDQMRDNLNFMQDFKPLDETERRNRKGAGNLSFDESDSVHRVPLLHGGLPEAHLHSRSVCAFEREADSPRLKRGLLLRRGAHLRRRQSVRLPRRRQM